MYLINYGLTECLLKLPNPITDEIRQKMLSAKETFPKNQFQLYGYFENFRSETDQLKKIGLARCSSRFSEMYILPNNMASR